MEVQGVYIGHNETIYNANVFDYPQVGGQAMKSKTKRMLKMLYDCNGQDTHDLLGGMC